MILGSKHVGAILNVLMQNFYICALVGEIIKCLKLCFFFVDMLYLKFRVCEIKRD